MTKREWVVTVFAAIMEQIPLDELSEELGDALTAYVESMGADDIETIYGEVQELKWNEGGE